LQQKNIAAQLRVGSEKKLIKKQKKLKPDKIKNGRVKFKQESGDAEGKRDHRQLRKASDASININLIAQMKL
jgi:hypothetical protein